MKAKIQQKLEAMLLGYLFLVLNLLMTVTGYSIVGLWFGIVAAGFFIRALRIKQ